MTSDKPIIAVAGSTSKQGRSVVEAALGSGRLRVRALTRSPASRQAQSLARMGAEIVAAPLAPGHDDEWRAAFSGASGAFLMTPPTSPNGSQEYELGCRLADAAVQSRTSCSARLRTWTRSRAGGTSRRTSRTRRG